MLHSYRDVFQTLPAYRKGTGSPPITHNVDRPSDLLGRPASQLKPKLRCQPGSQIIRARSDYSQWQGSSLPLVWVAVQDNVIPPHAVPFGSDDHGPLFIARAYLEGAFFLGKAGPQLTRGAIISYGSQNITVIHYDILVCAARLSWEIQHSSGMGFMRQDTVITKHTINHDLEQAPLYRHDIPENAADLADIYGRIDSSQRSATPDPIVVASRTRARSLAHGHSRYDLSSSNESSDVDIWKADATSIPLRPLLELTERSRSLPPGTRTSAESNFGAREDLVAFRSDSAQSTGVTAIVTTATHKPEYASMPHPSVATSSNAGVRLDWPIQESYRFPDAASAVEYSASEQGTPASPVARSEWTGFHQVANFDGCSEFSSPPPEPSAQSMHAGFVQDVLPLRRYENTAVAASTSVNHHTNQHFLTSATSRPLAKIVTAPQIASFSNPSPKDDSQLTLTYSPHSSHRMPSDSSLLQHSIAISRSRRASTPANPVSSLYPLDVVKDTSNSQSHLTSYPTHPATDAIGMSAGSDGFGHVNQYNQCAYPIDGTVAQAHGWRRSAQPQKYQSREGPRRGPQPPTIPSTALPPAPSSLVYDYADVDLRSTEHPPHGAPKRLRETLPEDGDAITSEHISDSEHWQLVSRTTFGIETQLCDGTEGDAVASELVMPIADTPVNAGIVKDEVKVLPHPASLITSASQITVDSGRGQSRTLVQESALERELVQENQVAVTASCETTSTGESTSIVPCRGTLVAESCVPLLTATCSPNSSSSRQQFSQTFSCRNDKLYRDREDAGSSVLVRVSSELGEINHSTPPQSLDVEVENTQKSSPISNALCNSSFTDNTSTIGQSQSLTADIHVKPCVQDVARDRLGQVSCTTNLKGEETSADRKHQSVEGREDHHERESESEVLTSSRSVEIFRGYMSESATSNGDMRMNEDADGTALSPSSTNTGSRVSPSEPGIPQDAETNHIQSGCEHQSLDVDTISKSSVQMSSHHSTERSEGYIHRQGRKETDSYGLARVSLTQNNAAPVQALDTAAENTQQPSSTSGDLRNSSLSEDTWTISQTSSSSVNVQEGSRVQDVTRDLLTEGCSFATTEQHKVDVQSGFEHQASEVIAVSMTSMQASSNCLTESIEGYTHLVDSLQQSNNLRSRMDEDAHSVVLSPSLTNTGSKVSPSELDIPQDAGTDHIHSEYEYQSLEVDIVSKSHMQMSIHHSTESGEGYIERQGCEEADSTVLVRVPLALGENNATPAQVLDKAIENTQILPSPASNDLRNSSFRQDTWTIGQTSSPVANLQRGSCSQDVAIDLPSQGSSILNVGHDEVDVSADCMRRVLETRTGSEVESLTCYSDTARMVRQSTSGTADDRRMDIAVDSPALPPSSTTTRPKMSLSEPGISQDVTTTHIQSGCWGQSSEVITVSTTCSQTSSHSSTESSECIRRQSARTFSCSDGPAIDRKLDQTDSSALVRLSLAHEENMHVEPAVISHPHAVVQRSMTLDASAVQIPSRAENQNNFSYVVTRSDGAREFDSRTARNVRRSMTQPAVPNDDRRMNADAEGAVAFLPSTHVGLKLSPSEFGVPQDAGTNHVQSGYDCLSSEVITVSTTSVQTLSDCFTGSREEYIHLDNSSQQSNSLPSVMSVSPIHDGSQPSPAFDGKNDSSNGSSDLIVSTASNEGTTVVASDFVEHSVAIDDVHGARESVYVAVSTFATRDACELTHDAASDDACENPISLDACESSVSFGACESSISLDACENPMSINGCERSISLDACEKPMPPNACEKPMPPNACERSISLGACEKPMPPNVCERSISLDACEKPMPPNACESSISFGACESLVSLDTCKNPISLGACESLVSLDTCKNPISLGACETSVSLDACERSISFGACESLVSLNACESLVSLNACENPISLGACETSVSLDACENPISLDACERSISFGACESSVSSGACESSISFGACESSISFGACESSISFGACESSVSSGACESSTSSGARETLISSGACESSTSSGARESSISLDHGSLTRQITVNYSVREEARVQQKLKQMGVCVSGFLWIKQSGGYRCAAGGHYISNAELGI